MIRTLIAAASMTALAGLAIAQPAARGPGPGGGFGLLALDGNADGKVERAEMLAAQRAHFDKIDANRDGQATPEEMKAFHDSERVARGQEMATRRFVELDKDGNGQVSQSEFTAGIQAGRDKAGADGRHGPGREFRARGPGPGPQHDGRGPDGKGPPGLRGDANADGKVSFAEFSARGIEAFDRADTNKDGVVTIAELQALRPSRP
jgi:hypothetical protein